MKATTKELAWLAGFMDGDGAIGITRMTIKRYCRGVYLRPHFQACSTDLRLVEEAARIIERATGKRPWVGLTHKAHGNKKQAWTFSFNTKWQLVILLPLLIPLLIGKKRQAELTLELSSRKYRRAHELDEMAYEECKAINLRGRQSDQNEILPKLTIVKEA